MKTLILPEELIRLHIQISDLHFGFRRMTQDLASATASERFAVEQAFEWLLSAIESCGRKAAR